MARTKKITDTQILDAARAAFKRFGFAATTAQIAEEAGVSEGSIFRRWSSKDELLIAALGIEKPAWVDNIEELAGSDQPIETQLEQLTHEVLDFFTTNAPKMAALLACGAHMKKQILTSGDALPVRGVKAVTKFFEIHRRAGRIEGTDPEIVARIFVGTVHHYAFAELAGLNDLMPLSRQTFVRGFIQNLLHGIAPRGEDE